MYAVNRRCPVGHGGQTFILVTIYLSKIGEDEGRAESGALRVALAEAKGEMRMVVGGRKAHEQKVEEQGRQKVAVEKRRQTGSFPTA